MSIEIFDVGYKLVFLGLMVLSVYRVIQVMKCERNEIVLIDNLSERLNEETARVTALEAKVNKLEVEMLECID